MPPRRPISVFDSHEVTNQSPPLVDYNLFDSDPILRLALAREGAGWAADKVRAFGAVLGSERVAELAEAANRYPPELRTFDRFGHRLDEVVYHPAYHELMALAKTHEVHSIAWTAPRSGGQVAHMALEYLLVQAEAGVCCPITMTYAAIPALRKQPDVATEWEVLATAASYDPRFIPAAEKAGVTIGMAMTEKQGGSDVRANTTRAVALGDAGAFELTGHKWFCSAPMSDAFLTLAQTGAGLSCFLVPRWRPDGTRNPFFIQRLKDKLGDRSNASSEIEYRQTWARLIGEEGQGVRTIIEMVHHTRLDTALAAAGLMRQAVVQAVHHTSHRSAFQRLLSDQPLMRDVLADLVVEWVAATMMAARVARSFDESAADPAAASFSRLAVAIGKYWINKRLPGHVCEALECHGGSGYVEESVMPRLYRQAPLNSIWEGSGNVICLDVLRTMDRDPAAVEALFAELEVARGGDRRLDRAIDRLKTDIGDKTDREPRARRIAESMAVLLQAALLVRHGPAPVADAFCASRLDGDWGWTYGTLPAGLALNDIIRLGRVSG
ncbi:acyl-CoA dehydrogenase family protein [Rhodospirillaceae bacterium SYSU D60014]|uniref:acyl-CoA dehydrogenase family protein n=1 Tax=Virgifigura deserti TaxID=2268457 RepID=UPI000E667B8A